MLPAKVSRKHRREVKVRHLDVLANQLDNNSLQGNGRGSCPQCDRPCFFETCTVSSPGQPARTEHVYRCRRCKKNTKVEVSR